MTTTITKLNKEFRREQILTAEELNAITGKVDEIIDGTSSLLSESDISYTQNELVAPSTGTGSYRIGDLRVGNKVLKLYGKDFIGGNGETPKNGGYYELAFKTFSVDVTLAGVQSAMPANGAAELSNGWSHSAENINGDHAIWMINRYVNGNGAYGDWQGPWRISGSNGENGIDGDTMEYIYFRSNISDPQFPSLSNTQPAVGKEGLTPEDDDFVPMNWYDNPMGVDPDNKYEWMAFRTKTGAHQGVGGMWSLFVGPVLWSSYGRNGTDGDGIEYIFCAKPDGQTYTSDPSTWPVSQAREYIANDEWTDDPVDIENLLQGARQWVSIRRKYADVDGEKPVWHAYSTPTLWSYFAKDGAVQAVLPAVQYSIQVTGSTVAVSYGEEDNTISGTITYRIMRSEGSNISLVGSSNEYNVTTAVMLGGDTACPDITYSDGTYSVDIHNRYEGYENYTEIIAYENNLPVATTVVPTIIPGQREVQALNLEVIRMRNWVNGATPAYNNGTVIEDGVKYLDVVEYLGNYYKCIIAGTSDIPGAPENVANPGWTILTGMGNAWFDTMIANNAYIKSITTKQIVVTSDAYLDNNGNVVEGNQVVAGMLNGNIIPTSMSGATNGNGIRIFAGTVPANGNVAECAFTVDNNGKLKANNAEITGTITATNSSFSGTVTATSGTFSNCTIDNSCTIQGMVVPVTVVVNNGDVYNLPEAADGSIYYILAMTASDQLNGNPAEIRCATYNVNNGSTKDAMFEYYNGSWNLTGSALPQNRHMFCQVVGPYTFIRKNGDWYAIFPY